MEIRTIGIGLGKTAFHSVSVNERDQFVVRNWSTHSGRV